MNIVNHNTLDNVHKLNEIIALPFDLFNKNKVEIISNEEEKAINLHTPSCESFTTTDHELLEEFFRKNKYPSLKEKHELAINLKSSPVKIQTWFQNQRAKIKRKNGTKIDDTLCSLKKSRISQTVESVIAREMKKVKNPISEIQSIDNDYSTTETISNLLSFINDSDKENNCQKDVLKNKNPTFIYGLWCGLNLFFGNASTETIDKFLNQDK